MRKQASVVSRKEQSTIEAVFLLPSHKPMFPFWRRKSKPEFNPGALAVRAECMCQYPSLNLNLFDLNICDQPKNIARITKAVLHKLFGKSSLNIRSVCPASPLHLSVLSVSPVPSVPVVLSVVMTMTTILSVIPVLSEQSVVIPSRGGCPRSTQLTYLKVSMVIFVRKLKVVHKHAGVNCRHIWSYMNSNLLV